MYQEFFGITGKPFQLSPDVNFFFPSNEHARALSFLRYGLEQADGFVIITGGVGTGKTTLMHTLLQELDPADVLVATVVTTQLKEDDLLELVAVNLGLNSENASKAVLLRELEQLFLQEAQGGRRVLLVVDEAQNLPPESVEELRMLSNFQSDGRPLLQIFMLGQDEFRETLLAEGFEQLRQRITATYHLNPLSVEETQTYIEHRLSRVGWQQDPDFSGEAFSAIYQFSRGVPRRINNLCDRLLLYAFLEEMHNIDAETVRIVSEEIGAELRLGAPARQPEQPAEPAPLKAAAPAGGDQPLETMARVMFDKANVQQRLAALERAVDGLGLTLKPEVAEIRDEITYVRNVLEDILLELRDQGADTPGDTQTDGKKRA
jgi:putative secretion ATPase (PEP-CTERM system associated)